MTKDLRDIIVTIGEAQRTIAEAREKCECSGMMSRYYKVPLNDAIEMLNSAERELDEAIKYVTKQAQEVD